LHIASTTRDQVYVGVANSLSRNVAAVYADVEAAYRSVFLHYLDPKEEATVTFRGSGEGGHAPSHRF
jgi:hypothetical protein